MRHQPRSVYLDRPAKSRRSTHQPAAHQARRGLAYLLSLVGLVGLTAAGILAGGRAIITDPQPTIDSLDAVLDDQAARAEIESELAAAILESFVAAPTVVTPELEAEAQALAAASLVDFRFAAAADEFLVDLHHTMVIEHDPTAVETSALTALVLGLAEQYAPQIASLTTPESRLVILDGTEVWSLSERLESARRFILLGMALGLALPVAAVIHPVHREVAVWSGRWMLAVAVMLAVGAVGAPYLAAELTGLTSVETATRSTGLRLLGPAGVAAVIGIGLASLASLARLRERRRTTQEGAAAAMGDGPLFTPLELPKDLESGLITGDRPLTSV